MTDMTAAVQRPGLAGVAPTYTAVTAADFFTAQPGSAYKLHYKCGATPTGAGSFKATDPSTPIPPGSAAVAGYADAIVQNAGMTATTELISIIPNSNRFRDAQGRINLVHTGTLTTVTLAISGPYPAM
jgi:hypothetical protein